MRDGKYQFNVLPVEFTSVVVDGNLAPALNLETIAKALEAQGYTLYLAQNAINTDKTPRVIVYPPMDGHNAKSVTENSELTRLRQLERAVSSSLLPFVLEMTRRESKTPGEFELAKKALIALDQWDDLRSKK